MIALAASGYVWAMAAIRHDPDWNRATALVVLPGDRHVTALRKLFNSMLGKLHHCLVTGQVYDPVRAAVTPAPTASSGSHTVAA